MRRKLFISIFVTAVMMINASLWAGDSLPAADYEKNAKQFEKLINAKTPDGKGMGLVPVNADYKNINLIADLEKKQSGKKIGAVDYSAYMPAVGNQGSEGSCVTWAAGYYYKTYQEAKQNNWDVKNSSHVFSPYFLWSNHGGGQYYNSFEVIRGFGCASMFSYPSYNTLTQPIHYAEAKNYKSLGYTAIFTNSIKYKGNIFASKYKNNIDSIKAWLNTGDCAVFAIPVFNSFFSYGGGVYDIVNPKSDPVAGLHAICCVGYDDTKQAFRIVNSWDKTWGEGGYAWISYNWVQKYVIETWVMFDETGKYQNDYTFTYLGSGTVNYDQKGIHITGGGPADTFKILRRAGVLNGNQIPQIDTDGSFANFYSDAPIGSLIVSGNIAALSSTEAVDYIKCGTIGKVKMIGTANSSWDYYNNYSTRYNYYDYTTIETTQVNPGVTQIDLLGVILDDFIGQTGDLKITAQTKTTKAKGTTYFSEGSITGNIVANNISTLTAKGGNIFISALRASGSIGTITATPVKAKISFAGTSFSVLSGGGLTINSLEAAGGVKSISAKHSLMKLSDTIYSYSGGFLTCGMAVTGLNSGFSGAFAGIGTVSGSLGVNGKFMAGATKTAGSTTYIPTYAGTINSISTGSYIKQLKLTPKIVGESWANSPVKFKGDHIHFIER